MACELSPHAFDRSRATRRRKALAGLLACVAVGVATAATPARADTVTDWNTNATTALIANAGQSPAASAITLAMVHTAMYDAVDAIDRRSEPYVFARRAPRWFSADAAASAAAHRVLVALVPAQQPALDAELAASLASIPDARARDGGVAVGEAAAAAMLAVRADDGRFGPYRFPTGTAPGVWRPTPPAFVNDPNAWVARVRPFLIWDPEAYRSWGPAPLVSRRYAREFNEVKTLGAADSAVRTEDQTAAARFWSGGYAPWIVAMRGLSARFGLDLTDDARLFALAYLNAADAGIACWTDKAHWLSWRPITAIHEADSDANPATEPDATWAPLIPTPPYPEHPSGVTCFSGALAATLQGVFGTDRISFSVTSAASGEERSYESFSQMVREAIEARIWSGLHFRSADEQAARIGRRVARDNMRSALRPLHG